LARTSVLSSIWPFPTAPRRMSRIGQSFQLLLRDGRSILLESRSLRSSWRDATSEIPVRRLPFRLRSATTCTAVLLLIQRRQE
jgi:hypothetical protein